MNSQILEALPIICCRKSFNVKDKKKGTIKLTFSDKVEILLRRKNWKKTEFADKLGITYRALANYLSGARNPRDIILKKICDELEVSKEFLLDEKQGLVLDSEERFIHNADEESEDLDRALDFLKDARRVFGGKGLVTTDKRALFNCIAEIYFDGITKE